MKKSIQRLQKQVRLLLVVFMVGLILSGITAFDILSGLNFLSTGAKETFAAPWINRVLLAAKEVHTNYEFLFYGYDWLAFAHLVIAIAFAGPYRDPMKNEWVITFGMIAAVLVLPATFLMGAVRHIPFWWQLIDCSFGVAGYLLLWIIQRKINELKLADALDQPQVIQSSNTTFQTSLQKEPTYENI